MAPDFSFMEVLLKDNLQTIGLAERTLRADLHEICDKVAASRAERGEVCDDYQTDPDTDELVPLMYPENGAPELDEAVSKLMEAQRLINQWMKENL